MTTEPDAAETRSAHAGPRPPMPAHADARTSRSLRGTLRWLLIAPLLPLALVSGMFVWTQWQVSRDDVYESLEGGAQSVAAAVDQEVEIGRAILDTLAASELIDRRDWDGFRRLAIDALRGRPDTWIALGESTGLQVMRTFEPVGAPTMNPNAFAQQHAEIEWRGRSLPLSTQGLSERIVQTGRMANTGIYFGQAIRRPAVAIGVPVRRGDRIGHVLIMGFSPDRIQDVILGAASPSRRISLVDASGRVIASSRGSEDATGRTVSDALRAQLATGVPGVREGPNSVGEDMVSAYRRTSLTDWSVVVGSPRYAAFSAARGVFVAWSLSLLALLVTSAIAARVLWQRIVPPLAALGRAARGFHQGVPAQLPPGGVAEIEELGALLREAASAEARRRDEALRRAVAEEHARATQAAADEQARSQARFRAAIEQLPHGVIIYDAQSRHEYLNGCAVELLGLSGRDLAGTRDESLWPAAVGAPYVEALALAVETRAVQSLEWPLPSPGVPDRVLAVTHAPLSDPGGTLLQVITIVYDLTERKRTERSLREADRQKDEFLAILSHELRNPLAPIRAASHVIRSRDAHDPILARAGDIIDRQVNQLVRLVDDLLEVSRITQGRIDLRMRNESLGEIVAAAVEAARPGIDAAGHALEVVESGAPIRVSADAARLSQAILNVLHNAAKYTPRGGRIALRAAERDGVARVEVEDDGIGIEPDALPRIFGMFVQGDRQADPGRSGGLGIGLALARRLVEMHGGSIRAHSDGAGLGSRFWIELPLAGADAVEVRDAEPAAPARRTPLRVLVVDDNVDAADTLRMLLALDGHSVRTSNDGHGALAAIAAERPDVVLLDIGLPDLDGLEVARRLRAKYGDACPRLIALSGWGQAPDKSRAAAAGFERHFTKPVDPEALVSALERPAGEPQAAA